MENIMKEATLLPHFSVSGECKNYPTYCLLSSGSTGKLFTPNKYQIYSEARVRDVSYQF